MFATGETVGLAEWIIYDICLVYVYISMTKTYANVLCYFTNPK